jgi:hypothetical protein
MFLVLAHHADLLARTVYDLLCKRRGGESTRLLTGDDLALNARWTLRQDGSRVRSEMHLPDGSRLSSGEFTAIFNRLRFATVPQFTEAGAADREYAVMEMHAFLLSWLAGLKCLVINAPSPRSLGGEMRGTGEWLLLAGRVGLPSRRMRFATNARRFSKLHYDPFVPLEGAGLLVESALNPTARAIIGSAPVHFLEPLGADRRRILVIGEKAQGDLPARLLEGCLRLARAGGCSLVEFTFARAATEGDWVFCDANPFPQNLERDEAEALVSLLESPTMRTAESRR